MKYYIDSKLQSKRPWETLGLNPDEIDWITDSDILSGKEKDEIWTTINKVLVAHRDILYKDELRKARILRGKKRIHENGKKEGHPLTDEEVDQMIHFKSKINKHIDMVEKSIKTALGL